MLFLARNVLTPASSLIEFHTHAQLRRDIDMLLMLLMLVLLLFFVFFFSAKGATIFTVYFLDIFVHTCVIVAAIVVYLFRIFFSRAYDFHTFSGGIFIFHFLASFDWFAKNLGASLWRSPVYTIYVIP